MSMKKNDDELYEIHLDRALSEMDVGITEYGENNVILEDNLPDSDRNSEKSEKDTDA